MVQVCDYGNEVVKVRQSGIGRKGRDITHTVGPPDFFPYIHYTNAIKTPFVKNNLKNCWIYEK